MKHERERKTYSVAPLLLLAAISFTPLLLASPAVSVAALTGTCLHLIRFCFATLAKIDPVLHAIPWTLAALGVLMAIVRCVRPTLSAARLIHQLPSRRPTRNELVGALSHKHGVLDRTRVIAGSAPNPAFTSGIITPRIYLSETLATALTPEQLESVILHEAHHLRRRDPLRYFLVSVLANLLFWVPLVREAISTLAVRLEFEADDAARRLGDLVVASAILGVADLSNAQRLHGAALFVSPHLLERRVNRLLGSAEQDPPRMKGRPLGVTITVVLLLWSVGVASSAAHAAHIPHSDDRCTHDHHGVLHAGTAHH